MKYLDYRSYPKMELPADPSLSYLIGVEAAMRFILSIPLQAVPLSAVEALDRVEEMQDVIFEEMEDDV